MHNLTTLEETASVQIWKPEFDYNMYWGATVDGESTDSETTQSSSGGEADDGWSDEDDRD